MWSFIFKVLNLRSLIFYLERGIASGFYTVA